MTMYPEVLADLLDHLTKTLRGLGVTATAAGRSADAAVKHIADHWGGQTIYFPKCAYTRLLSRDKEIWAKWNGRNALDLCREYRITQQRLYQILRKLRKDARARSAHDVRVT